jgi:hypothetical protein
MTTAAVLIVAGDVNSSRIGTFTIKGQSVCSLDVATLLLGRLVPAATNTCWKHCFFAAYHMK